MNDLNAAGSGVGGRVCPICRKPITPDTPQVMCSACGSLQHQACWEKNSGCSSIGCNGQPVLQAAPMAPPPEPMSPQAGPLGGSPTRGPLVGGPAPSQGGPLAGGYQHGGPLVGGPLNGGPGNAGPLTGGAPAGVPTGGQPQCPSCGHVLGPFDTSCPGCSIPVSVTPRPAAPKPQQQYTQPQTAPNLPPGAYQSNRSADDGFFYGENAGSLSRWAAAFVDNIIVFFIAAVISVTFFGVKADDVSKSRQPLDKPALCQVAPGSPSGNYAPNNGYPSNNNPGNGYSSPNDPQVMTPQQVSEAQAEESSKNKDKAVLVILWFAYEVIMTAAFGATVGKFLFGTRVVRYGVGKKLSFGAALGRSIVKFLTSAMCFFLFLYIVFSDEHRALHDLAANSEVVSIR